MLFVFEQLDGKARLIPTLAKHINLNGLDRLLKPVRKGRTQGLYRIDRRYHAGRGQDEG